MGCNVLIDAAVIVFDSLFFYFTIYSAVFFSVNLNSKKKKEKQARRNILINRKKKYCCSENPTTFFVNSLFIWGFELFAVLRHYKKNTKMQVSATNLWLKIKQNKKKSNVLNLKCNLKVKKYKIWADWPTWSLNPNTLLPVPQS